MDRSSKMPVRSLTVMAGGLVAFTGIGNEVLSFAVPRSSATSLTSSRASASAALPAVEVQAASSLPSGTQFIAGAAGVLAISGLASSQRRAARGHRAMAVQRCAVTVGDRVQWSGKDGTVSYVGAAKFASGEWVGVTLDSPEGMHDGSVMGVSYFACAPKCGVFAQAAQLAVSGVAAPTPAPAAAPPAATPAPASAPTASASGLAVGTKVSWNGKAGTVSYVGSTKFAAGEWVGVTLDAAEGMHDGTVMGTTYFECAPKCGVFAQAAQLAASGALPAPVAAPAVAAAPAAAAPASAAAPAAGSLAMGAKVSWNGKAGTVSYVGSTKFASGEWVGITLDAAEGMHDGTVMGVAYFKCAQKCGVFAQAAQLGASGAAPAAPAAPAAAAPAAAAPVAAAAAAATAGLAVGNMVSWNGKEGTVRYIGAAKFAPGEWVGVELAAGAGMHNGSVMGFSYFECADKCGVFAQPSQLSVLASA